MELDEHRHCQNIFYQKSRCAARESARVVALGVKTSRFFAGRLFPPLFTLAVEKNKINERKIQTNKFNYKSLHATRKKFRNQKQPLKRFLDFLFIKSCTTFFFQQTILEFPIPNYITEKKKDEG